MLFVASGLVVLTNIKNDIIIVSGDNTPEENRGIGLDYNYMWNVTTYLSNAVHKYNTSLIPKGRAFGSWGCENYSQDYIYHLMKDIDKLNLSDVKLEKLGPLPGKYSNQYYTSVMDVSDYRLTILHPDYEHWLHQPPYPRTVPWSECFPMLSNVPTVSKNYTMNETDNVRVIREFSNGWPYTGLLTNSHKKVTCEIVNGGNTFGGNVSLIENSNELPEDQIGRVFLIYETPNCEDILDNITTASGVIMIYYIDPGYTIPNATQYSFNILRVNGDDPKLDSIIDKLEDHQLVYVDNVDTDTLEFIYDLPSNIWPNYNFMLIVKIDTTSDIIFGLPPRKQSVSTVLWLSKITTHLYNENQHHPYQCKGLIIYSEKEDGTHLMAANDNGWNCGLGPASTKIKLINQWSAPFYSLPIFSVNNSVGYFLNSRSDETMNTVSGYINQTYYEEIHDTENFNNSTAGIDAYDIAGHINIPKSPQNKIILIGNRCDSWFGECPSDSGAGAGIVLTLFSRNC